MMALIDGDIVCYRCAASCQKQGAVVEPLEVALARTDDLMHRIIYETESTSYRVFLSGSENFRYAVYPAYKANRKDMAKPEYLQQVREHLVVAWKAELSDGIEADDEMGIAQYSEYSQHRSSTTIASIDKDMLMIPGRHYNFVTNEFTEVSTLDGIKHFYLQLILGDRADNIPGYDGKMRSASAIPKFLQPLVNDLNECTDEEDMDILVKEAYTDQDQYEINKKLLWILREPREAPQ